MNVRLESNKEYDAYNSNKTIKIIMQMIKFIYGKLLKTCKKLPCTVKKCCLTKKIDSVQNNKVTRVLYVIYSEIIYLLKHR